MGKKIAHPALKAQSLLAFSPLNDVSHLPVPCRPAIRCVASSPIRERNSSEPLKKGFLQGRIVVTQNQESAIAAESHLLRDAMK